MHKPGTTMAQSVATRIQQITVVAASQLSEFMFTQLKPLAEQSIVITGASSGIGLVTAERAARRGARVTLVARNRTDLERAVEAIRRDGGRAIAFVADVSGCEQVEAAADAAVAEFGAIDTWVNNAGVSIYGRLVDVPIDEMRRQFDVV